MADEAEQLLDVSVDPDLASSPVGKQWRSIMNLIIFTQRVIRTTRQVPSEIQVGNGGPEGDHHQPVEDQEPAKDFGLTEDRQLSEDDEIEFMKSVHQALLQQLSTHGIILTLLASIAFVVFLQPPGSLDSTGLARSTTAVQSFLFFSSVSFMFARAGLQIVWIGSASLLRPKFFDFEDFIEKFMQKYVNQIKMEPLQRAASDATRERIVFDSVPSLCEVLLVNVDRVKRLRKYMALSCSACIAAFVCAGLAITAASSNPRTILIAGICFGSLPLTGETLTYLAKVQKKARLGSGTTSFRLQDVSR